ncbi:MAG: tetratricopeptide repeat protein [Devosia sp.]
MSTDTIIREVDEELRRDRMRKLWRQAGPWVIGGAVAVVIGVAGYEGWTWWEKSQSSRSSDQFYAATQIADGTDIEAAKKALDGVIAQGSGGYPMLAQFREAALLAQNGKIDEAVTAYDSLSTSLDNTHLRELALVLAANLLIDKGDVSAVEQRVGGVMIPSSPMRNAAREEMGLVQYKAGKLDDAMKSFQTIIDDPLASRDLQSRIQIYMLQLQAEGAKTITPPAPDAPTTVPSSAQADVSVAPSTAVDASTELDVVPPVIDTSALSMAVPQTSAAPSAASSEQVSAPSSASLASSSAP